MSFNPKGLLVFLIPLLPHYNSFGQCALSGKVTDSLQVPVPFITVALLHQSDSSIYKGIISGENGEYCFENIKKGSFILKTSGVGYSDHYSKPFTYDSSTTITIPEINIGKSAVNLNEVSVSAIKNPIELS